MIAFLLLTCELLIIHLGRTRDRRWFLALPAVFAVWVNCHGSFVMGLLVIGVYLFSSSFDFRAGSLVSVAWVRETRNMLMFAFAGSVAALFINPTGWRQVVYPFDLMFRQKLNLAAIEEWQPLDLTDGRGWALLACGALVFVWILLRRDELRLDELLLFALGFGMAVRHERMLFLFGVLAAPILTRLLANEWDQYDPARDHPIANAILIGAAAMIVVTSFPRLSELQEQVKKDNPVAAVDFIRRNGLKGRMLNDYLFGGYLIWALPEQKVFIDGRADIFEWTGVLREYGAWATLQNDPKLLLDKYKIDFCLLRSDAAMTRVMPYFPRWNVIYADEKATLFANTAGAAR
jgi:hypothetical protein